MHISKFTTANIEERIQAFEAQYAVTLPEQYRGFLMKYNGGRTPETDFHGKKLSTDVRAFFGIGSDIDEYSFSHQFAGRMQNVDPLSGYLKKDVLPFAEDSFGNTFVIGIAQDNTGKIYFCDHERGKRLKVIAADFAEFISLCKSKPVDTNDVKSPEELEQETIAKGKPVTDLMRVVWKDIYAYYSDLHLEEIVL